MNLVDIIILVLLFFGAFSGFKKGLVLEVLGLLAFILAIIGGFYLMHLGVDFLSTHFEIAGTLLPVLSFLLIFISIIFLVNLLGKALKKVLDMTLLGSVDNVAGALIGMLKWAFGLSILLWITAYLDIQAQHYFQGSAVLPYIEPIAPRVFEYISFVIPYLNEIFESIEDSLRN